MDSLFEFESKRTHKMLKELARKSILTNPFIYLLYGFALTFLFFFILFKSVKFDVGSIPDIVISIIITAIVEIIFLVPVVLFFVAYTALLIFIRYKISKMRDLEIANGELVHYHIKYYQDQFMIFSETDGSNQNFKYSQIKRITLSKNNCCIFTKGHQTLIFSKSSITKGNIKEFVEFMRTKGFKL